MARTFTITQEGESREFTVATGVGPSGVDGVDAEVTLASVRAAVPNMVEVASPAENDFIQRGPSGWLTKSIEQVKTALGLGTLATQSGTFSGTSSGTNTGDQDLSGYLPLTGGTMTGAQLFGAGGYVEFASGSYAGFLSGAEEYFEPGSLAYFNNGTIKLQGATYQTSINFTDPTAARTIIFPNATGTIALTSDISGTNSGTNTGDITVTDSAEIDFTLTGQALTASLIAGSIDETKLDASVNASLDLADTSVQPASTNTLTNKRIGFRITTITSSATPAVNTDNCDCVTITALAAAITSMTSSLTGTPSNFDQLLYRIKDNGTARAITWGASFVARGGILPTTTVISKVWYVLFVYNTVTATWDCVSSALEV